jgi:argininosuccinate lyase
MPQKKNPDVAELVRGKSGRVYGALVSLLTMMKGLPLAYNKDMQEDKQPTFDAYDTLISCLDMFTKMLNTITFNTAKMKEGALEGYTNATDLADYLVEKGVAFRDAHTVSGRIVLHCEKLGIPISGLILPELKQFSDVFEADVYNAISLDSCIERRNVPGGPAPSALQQAINISAERLEEIQHIINT